MAFIVSKQGRADANVKLVKGVLLRLKNYGIEWTNSSLKEAAGIVGVYYSDEELKEVLEGLYNAGIIEDVKEVIVELAPVPSEPAVLIDLIP